MAYHYLAILVVLGLAAHHASAFNCYSCATTISAANVETPDVSPTTANPCAEVTSVTATQDATTYACMTTFTNSGSTFSISRKVATGFPASTTGSYCTNSDKETICYCSSDKCNSQTVSAPRTYNCYECMSSEYFDNGCGEKLDTSKGFVQTTTGCSACYKTVTIDTDMTVRYQRSCSRGIQVDESCIGDESEDSSRKCACKKNLCNSAESHVIKSSTAICATVISALLKYFR